MILEEPGVNKRSVYYAQYNLNSVQIQNVHSSNCQIKLTDIR